jgi:AbrB family looped-hinge helix DNA binding protein
MHSKLDKTFYGTATLGERGQVVIPAKARKALALNKGEELLVFGMAKDMIVFSKLSMVKNIIDHLSKDIKTMRKAISNLK